VGLLGGGFLVGGGGKTTYHFPVRGKKRRVGQEGKGFQESGRWRAVRKKKRNCMAAV